MNSGTNASRQDSAGPTLSIAAIQMEANVAPTAERLARAERLVVDAAQAGAQLILLPECFNTGYAWADENHAWVETLSGTTATWLAATAAWLDVHLAGSLMLLDGDECYNALLLFAPDGRMWRYDKNYPYGWERGYFRPSRRQPNITVADTDLGKIGMLICWDVGHLDLWQAYVGQVDLLLIASCPVDAGGGIYHLPNGDHFTIDDMGSRVAVNSDAARLTFGEMIDQQAAWLGVPVIHATGLGHIRTEIPLGRRALLGFALAAPRLLKYLPQANGMEMSFDLVHECKILDADGRIVARLAEEDGERYTLAEVRLAQSPPVPQAPQPPSLAPGIAYFLADTFLPAIAAAVYRRGQRRWRSN
ncbi:MAG: carbon-nitrogen hydrolase family protein [Chloroflexota bacterium]|nr:MAG: carbon-nitrogen hydrolase family protein [Chloroflexota bacterium]